jgi:hypothetical protein
MIRWADVESFQKSGCSICSSSSDSFDALPGKSKTHHDLLSQAVCRLQAFEQVLHDSSKCDPQIALYEQARGIFDGFSRYLIGRKDAIHKRAGVEGL